MHHDVKDKFLRLYITQYHSSLRAVIKRKLQNVKDDRDAPFSLREICIYCVEILDGIEFLHEQNVVHRDLKSHNIFVMLDTHNQITQIGMYNVYS